MSGGGKRSRHRLGGWIGRRSLRVVYRLYDIALFFVDIMCISFMFVL